MDRLLMELPKTYFTVEFLALYNLQDADLGTNYGPNDTKFVPVVFFPKVTK